MGLTEHQHQAILAEGDVLLLAGAGAGKTQTLVQRCLDRLLRDGSPASLDRMLMVTFTEAAAAEMRHRIRLELQRRSAEQPENIHLAEQLARLDTAHIGTLHSFCLRLIRDHFDELELDPQLQILDDTQTHLLAAEALDELLERHYRGGTDTDLAVQEFIVTYGRGHDDTIRRLIRRVHAYGQTLPDPEDWLAQQQQHFAQQQPLLWLDWLLEAVTNLRDEWMDEVRASRLPNLQNLITALERFPSVPSRADAVMLLAAILAADQDWPHGAKTRERPAFKGLFDTATFLAPLATVENDNDPLAEDWSWLRPHLLTLVHLVREFAAGYAAAKRQNAALDFHDLEQFALRLLWDRAANAPSAIARQWRERLDHVFVDEYQDINAAQDRIITALSRDGARANRFLVGDVKQCIYRFRLANPRIFQRYAEEWSGSNRSASAVLPDSGAPVVLTPHPGPLPVEGRGRSDSGVGVGSVTEDPSQQSAQKTEAGTENPSTFSLSPQRGEGQGEGCGSSLVSSLRPSSRRTVIPLADNFRSREAILEFINDVFAALMRRELDGVEYDDAARLRFGQPAERTALALAASPTPAVELLLHLTSKDATSGEEEEDDLANLNDLEREARQLALRFAQLRESGFPVWDRATKGFRPARWSDMVVLLRAPSGRASTFAQEFARAGVPLSVAGGEFYQETEITDLLSLLQLLDNPLQDGPVIAVLRSPIVGLTLDELAQVRLALPRGRFWTALQVFHDQRRAAFRPLQHHASTAATEFPSAADCEPRSGVNAAPLFESLSEKSDAECARPRAQQSEDFTRTGTVDARCGSNVAAPEDGRTPSTTDAASRSNSQTGSETSAAHAKVSAFLENFARWRKLARQASLSQCLETILDETCYEDWLLTQTRGESRRANVQRLLTLTRRFDVFQRQGLHRFQRFVAAQRDAEASPEPAAPEARDCVRLMSIHKSKGLEFPVVAVAGLGGRFNLSADESGVLLDEQYGLCAKIKPPGHEGRYPSLPFQLAQSRQRRESLGEELRLLYVAMTRACDRLILSGTTSRTTAEKWLGTPEVGPLPQRGVVGASHALGWLGPLIARLTAQPGWLEQANGTGRWLAWRLTSEAPLERGSDASSPECGRGAPAALSEFKGHENDREDKGTFPETSQRLEEDKESEAIFVRPKSLGVSSVGSVDGEQIQEDQGTSRDPVAAGVSPAVEPGVPPGGTNVMSSERVATPGAGPGGRMPPSTAGGTPAATEVDEAFAHLQTRLAWRYDHVEATRQPAKGSVSALRRRLDEADEEAQPLNPVRSFRSRRVTSTDGLSAAEIGLAHHHFLEHVDLSRAAELAGLREESARLVREGFLRVEEAAQLDLHGLASFWQSELGTRLRENATLVKRELEFTARFSTDELDRLGLLACNASTDLERRPPARQAAAIPRAGSEIGVPAGSIAGEEFVVIQGVADLVAVLPYALWLVDFKTDQLDPDDVPARLVEHGKQLRVYARALERIYRRPVKECVVCFLALRRVERIEVSAT